MTIEELGKSVKAKYPQYASISDAELGQKTLDKYPSYQSKVTTTAPEQKVGFVQGVKDAFKKRASSLSEGYADQMQGKQTLGESVGQTAGETVGLIGDIALKGLSAITPEFIKKPLGQVATTAIQEIGKTGIGQQIGQTFNAGMEAYGDLSPRAQRNLRAIGNIATAIPVGKFGGVAAKEAANLAGDVATAGLKVAGQGAKAIGTGVAKTTEFAVAQATGLSPNTIRTVIANPKAFTKTELENVTREALASQVYKGITRRLDDLSSTGAGYNTIKKSADVVNIPANTVKDILSKRFNIFFDDTNKIVRSAETTPLKSGDIAAIEDFVQTFGDQTQLSANAFLNARGTLSNLAAYDSAKSTISQVIAKELRKELDDYGKKQIKGLKQLDAKYAPEVKIMKEIKKDYLKPNGEFKDGALSKLANLTKEGRQPVLERLKKVIPDIDKQINILRSVEDIGYAQGQKVGAYGRSILGGGIGFATGGLGGVLISQILTNPYAAVLILRQYGLAKAALKPFINNLIKKMEKGIKLTRAELQFLNEAVDDMAKKLETKAKEMPAGLSMKDVTTMSPDDLAKTGLKIDPVTKKSVANLPDEIDPATKKIAVSMQKAKDSGQSFDDWVKTQGKPLLHGGPEAINEFKYAGKRGFGGVYLTPDTTMAKTFSGKEGQITEAFVKPKKVFKIQKGSDTLAGSGGMGDDILVEAPHNYPDEIKRLKEQGYDAIRSSDGKQLLVLDPSQIKTKSQLTDIWKKANK